MEQEMSRIKQEADRYFSEKMKSQDQIGRLKR